MADSTQLPSAQQARDDDRRALDSRRLVHRSGSFDLLDPPSVASMIPQDPDGLLDAIQIADEIIVQIPSWGPNPAPVNEQVMLLWVLESEPEVPVELATVTVPPGTQFPLQVSIPSNKYYEGRLLLSYEGRNFSGNQFFSEPLLITVDTIPPYGNSSPESLVLPEGAEVITDAYLDAGNGTVALEVPVDYDDKSDDDTVYFYWLKTVPENIDQLPPPSIPPFTLGQSTTVILTRELLAQVGDGICHGVYLIKDKANNFSRISYWASATVALGLLPDNLQPPQVPLANDGRIDRLDAHAGVVVEIPAFDNVKNGDLLLVKWGDTDLALWPTGPSPQFPIRIPVPWQAIDSNYDYDSEPPLQPVTVSYQVSRVGLRFPAQPLTREVNVQLRVVGPDTPDAPDPVNPNLPVLVVRGESNQDNKLVESDNGKPAKATFLLFANAKENDEITLHWGGLVNLQNIYYVKATDEPGVTEISIDVPWSIIQEAGNSLEFPVFYRISDAEQVNYQQSPTTTVNVQAIIVELPAPEFPDVVEVQPEFWVLNCSSIKEQGGNHGFRVHVPPSEHIKEGMEVTFDWIVAENQDGTGSINGTELTEKIVVTAEQQRSGIDWFIQPYETKILPAFSGTQQGIGYTRLKYSTLVGQIPTESVFVHVLIGLSVGGGSSCPLP